MNGSDAYTLHVLCRVVDENHTCGATSRAQVDTCQKGGYKRYSTPGQGISIIGYWPPRRSLGWAKASFSLSFQRGHPTGISVGERWFAMDNRKLSPEKAPSQEGCCLRRSHM
ncbi:hypothetical protein J6590_062377 [Homalodisca vitripennis]|nr:hypothetical protein J6590_062377 [Homalodisca vitripennis]